MKNNKTTLAVVGAVALGLTGMAHAGSVSDTSTVTVNVEASCDLYPADDHVINVANGQSAGSSNGKYFFVTCSDQLPYTLEVNTKAGGLMDVYDANTGAIYEVKFVNAMTGTALGTAANGEAISAVGNGFGQNHPYNVQFNTDWAYGLAKVGSYYGEYVVSVSF